MPIAIELDYYPLTIIPKYGIIAGLDSLIMNQKSAGFSLFKVKSSVALFVYGTDLCLESGFHSSNSSPIA